MNNRSNIDVFQCLFTIVRCWGLISVWLGKNIPLEALIALPVLLSAILVPMAIFAIDVKGLGFEWDKSVILLEVLKAKRLFVSLIALAVSPLCWDLINLRPILVVAVTIAIAVLINSIIHLYFWLIVTEVDGTSYVNYRAEKRMAYLDHLDDSQKHIVWLLTWGAKTEVRSLLNDRDLVQIFLDSMAKLSSKAKDVTGVAVLQNFKARLGSINLNNPEIHKSLLHFSLKWSKYLTYPEESSEDLLGFSMTAEEIYWEIAKRDIKSGFGAYLLFKDTTNYLSDSSVESPRFMQYFAPTFLSIIHENAARSQLWRHFPDAWKITAENLSSQDSRSACGGWLDAYINWVLSRDPILTGANSAYDWLADEVTSGLLPTIDPVLWSDLIVFQFASFVGDVNETKEHAQIRGFLEHKKHFGKIGRMHVFAGGDDGTIGEEFKRAEEAEVSATVDLYLKIFPLFSNNEYLEKFIAEIDNFENQSDPNKKMKLARLKEIFEIFIKYKAKKEK